MGLFDSLFNRENGRKHSFDTRFFVQDFESSSASTYNQNSSSDGYTNPPFAVAWSLKPINLWLAFGDEEGDVTILQGGQKFDVDSKPQLKWNAHHNTIFDLCWADEDTKIVTVSGDQTGVIWDTETNVGINKLMGHSGSVKSVSNLDSHLFATGGRDGNVYLWDNRVAANGNLSPIMGLRNIHSIKVKKRRRRLISNSPQSVTAVTFLKQQMMSLATAGAADGTIKIWDLRILRSTQNQNTAKRYLKDPIAILSTYSGESTSERKRGISSIAVNVYGNRLIANSTDDRVCMYNLTSASLCRSQITEQPMTVFRGHTHGSFYVKSKFSPDGDFIISGSGDHNAYIWEVDWPSRKPIMLQGHKGEVSGVDWCTTDFTKIASCSDDATVRIWTIRKKNHTGLRRCLFPPIAQVQYEGKRRGNIPSFPEKESRLFNVRRARIKTGGSPHRSFLYQ